MEKEMHLGWLVVVQLLWFHSRTVENAIIIKRGDNNVHIKKE